MRTIRLHLQWLIGGSVLVLGIACAMGSYLLLSWLAENEVQHNAQEMAKQAELELDRLLLPPTSLLNLLSNVPDLKTGRLSDWIVRLPAQSSLLRANPMLESVYVGGPHGEFLSLRQIKNQYDRRRFAVGDNVVWLVQAQRTSDMREDGQLRLGFDGKLKVLTRSIDLSAKDYDPRLRLWYLEAIGAGHVIRTQPYTFYSSGREGITLARDMGKGFVVAMDINLKSLSPRLKRLAAKWSARFWLFSHDGHFIVGDQATADKDPMFSNALRADHPDGSHDGGWMKGATGESWWLGSTPVRLDGRDDMDLVYAIPSSVILGKAELVRNLLIAITALILAIMLYVARKSALRFSRPLELLAQASSRVGQLEFQDPIHIKSDISEVKQLADAHDRMRIMLLENQNRINAQQHELKAQLQTLHQAEQRLEQLNADQSATLLAIPDLLFELSEEGEYINVWARDPELLTAQKEALLGHTVNQMLPADAAETVMEAIHEASASGTSFGKIITLDLPNGRHWFELSTSAKSAADHVLRSFMMLSRDITERIASEERIEHLAFHDPLTGLPNRALLLDRLSQALAVARRTLHYGAVMFIDLDQFKNINEVYGHGFGDKVLNAVADVLRRCLREGDTVARLGGDEFVILLPGLSDDEETASGIVITIGEKLRTALEKLGLLEGQAYSATASIGISLFPRQGETVDDLIREADIARYRAKERGRNTLVFFEDDMQATITKRFAMEQALREAIKGNSLQLFLQSKVNRAGKVIGAEALVRWPHPVQGMIMPAMFIPLAEETGLIGGLGEWVLREACRLIVQLTAMGQSLHLAVNVSPRQFHQANFVAKVKDILAETGADPLYLTLEITESLLVERPEEVASRMLELTKLGIRFSIDDFGTGYSSLSYLKRLPLNELKIDKSFVQDIPQDSNDAALVETILSMAHHLGFEVVAEGVETDEQFVFLVDRQCEYFQGYLFHRPQPAQAWLASLKTDAPTRN